MALKLPLRKPTRAAHTMGAHRTHQINHGNNPKGIAEYAPNNADSKDNRGFMGAQAQRKEEERKRMIAYRMRVDLKRRALLNAIKTGKIKLPARK